MLVVSFFLLIFTMLLLFECLPPSCFMARQRESEERWSLKIEPDCRDVYRLQGNSSRTGTWVCWTCRPFRPTCCLYFMTGVGNDWLPIAFLLPRANQQSDQVLFSHPSHLFHMERFGSSFSLRLSLVVFVYHQFKDDGQLLVGSCKSRLFRHGSDRNVTAISLEKQLLPFTKLSIMRASSLFRLLILPANSSKTTKKKNHPAGPPVYQKMAPAFFPRRFLFLRPPLPNQSNRSFLLK